MRWLTPSDVGTFEQCIQEQKWLEAIHTYQDSFFSKYSFRDLATYNAWIEFERERLERLYLTALDKQIERFQTQENYEAAAELCYKRIHLDEFDEEATRNYLRTLTLANKKDLALKYYNHFVSLLKQDLDSIPQGATLELIEDIKADTLNKPEKGVAKRNLPDQATRFIGRKHELADIAVLLANPDCRLLSFVGLGGIGKTRLALEVAREHINVFKDGVYFIPLAAVNSEAGIITAITQTLGFKLGSQDLPKIHLANHLKTQNLLIILDNFEHLLSHSHVVGDLLEASHSFKIVVTSRESLKLKSEWLYDVQGLSFPKTKHQDNLQNYEAVQLFLNGVKRVAPMYRVQDQELSTIAEIARNLEGLPLAIELASSWARIMPLERIKQELEQGIDFLETNLVDVPERHRSIKTLLDTTWANLSEQKREALMKLSVFVGGCELEAAEKVTQTPASILLSLVNETLLKRSHQGRFEIHEVIQQYVAKRISKIYDLTSTDKSHFEYFESLARSAYEDFNRGLQPILWEERFRLEYRNIYKALDWILKNNVNNSYILSIQLESLWIISNSLYDLKLSYHKALEHHPNLSNILKAKLLILRGMCAFKLSDYKESEDSFHQGLELIRGTGELEFECQALRFFGAMVSDQGDHIRGAELMSEGLATARAAHKKRLVNAILGDLGVLNLRRKNYSQAQAMLEEALAMGRERGDKRFMANHLINLANLYRNKNELSKAKRAYQDCLVLAKEVQNEDLEAVLLVNLGHLYYLEGNCSEAFSCQLQGLKGLQRSGNRFWFVNSLLLLAKTFLSFSLFKESAFLLGAIESLGNQWKIAILPNHHDIHQQVIHETRSNLDSQSLEANLAKGRFTNELANIIKYIEGISVGLDSLLVQT